MAGLAVCLAQDGQAANLTVTTAADEFDSPTGAIMSLREAVRDANTGDVILFDAAIFADPASVITLGSEIVIDKSLALQADGFAGGVTISGGGVSRLFSVTPSGNLSLTRLTLRDGVGVGAVENGFGGALYNDGTLVLDGCTLVGNTAASGGAIFNRGSLTRTLMVSNSTLKENSATTGSGGAIYNDGTLTLTQSTVTENSALVNGTAGGGLYNLKTLTISQSTIIGNFSPRGGGIGVFDGSRTSVRNSIVADNLTASAGTPADIGFNGDPLPAFNFIFTAPNIIGSNGSVSESLPAGPLVGTNEAPLDPQVYPLALYGGPTETMPLRPGSPGIDIGNPSSLADDQRGFERTLGAGVDLGSVEASAGNFQPDGLTLFADIPNAAAAPGSTVKFQISTDPEFLPTVNTFAGAADVDGLEDGSRLSSKFRFLTGVAQDATGNFFVADTGNHRIRMITPEGVVSTIAGSGQGLFGYGYLDGPGALAKFAFPSALAVGPNGNLFVADTFNQRIRKLTRPGVGGDPWVVTTLAGNGISGFRNGSGAAAQFNQPQGVVVDSLGNVFVADSANFRIRRITPDGASVTTYAGIGSPFLTECVTNGTTTVTCSSTENLAVGQLLFGDNVPAGAMVSAVVNETTFEMSAAATGAGSELTLSIYSEGLRTSATLNTPYGLAFSLDGSKLYVADRDNHRIREITMDRPGSPAVLGVVSTFAGTGAIGFDDDPIVGPAGSATFRGPVAIAVDLDDNLFIVDEFNHAIRKITPGGLVSTVAGLGFENQGKVNGRSDIASFDCPAGLVVDRVNIEGTLVVADTQNHLLRRVVVNPLEIEATVGTPNLTTGRTPIFADLGIEALSLNPDTTYFTRWVTTAPIVPNVQMSGQSFYLFPAPTIATVAQSDLVPVIALLNANVNPNGNTTTVSFEFADNPQMTGAQSVVVSPSFYQVAGEPDFEASSLIPQPATAGGTVYIRAVATNARGTVRGEIISFTFPVTEVVTLDASNRTRTTAMLNANVNALGSSTSVKFEYSTGSDLSDPWQVSTAAGSGEAGLLDAISPLEAMFSSAQGVAASGGDVYLADRENHRIRKIAASGLVSTFAGSSAGFADGNRLSAKFDNPSGIVADGNGNLFIADEFNHRIRRINIASGQVTTIAGSSTAGYLDDLGAVARFLFPKGVTINTSGDLYIADTGNHAIRKITMSTGLVETLAGDGTEGLENGAGNVSRFSMPQGLTVNAAGDVFIADTGNHAIRKITTAGIVTTLAGTGSTGFLDGPGDSATFASPVGIVSLGDELFVTDRDNHRIRSIAGDGLTGTLAGSELIGRVDSPIGLLHPAIAATFGLPSGIATDSNGDLWVTDIGNHDLRKIARIPLPFVEAPTALSGNSLESVGESIGGLLAGSTYYFRAVGTNAIGPIEGDILSFTTLTNQAIAVYDGPDLDSPKLESGQSTVVNFGVTPDGTPVPRTFTISNSGEWNLTVSSVDVPAGFAASMGSGVIAAGETETFEVVLEATFGATPTGELMISSDDPEQGTFTLPIAGVVLSPPTVTTQEADTDGGVVLRGLVHPELSATAVGFHYSTDPEVDGFAVSTLAGLSSGFADGTGDDARFNLPSGVVIDGAGNVYVADTRNHCIRRITPSGATTIFAGTNRIPGFADGAPDVARFNEPTGIAIDSAGTLFVTDSKNHRIRAISNTGQVSTYAGFGEASFTDGVGTAARFNQPAGIAVDSAGVLYVADQLNHRVRKIALDQTVSTLAGSGSGGSLNRPSGIAVAPNGVVYLTEESSHQISRIDATGNVESFAGGTAGFVNATGPAARFSNPSGLAVNSMGQLFVADSGNHRIRVVDLLDRSVTTFAGSGDVITRDGDDGDAAFASPISITTNGAGDVIVGESINSVIRRIVSSTETVLLDEVLDGSLGEILVTAPVTGMRDGETYYYRVFARNGGGTSFGEIRAIGVAPLTGFPLWQSMNFPGDTGNPTIAGPAADPDGDGIDNLLEYAYFLDPNVPSLDGIPTVSVDTTSVSLEYPNVPTAIDLVYTAEWSTDLLDWKTDGVTEAIISSTADVQQIAASISRGSAEKIFFRVRVTLQ